MWELILEYIRFPKVKIFVFLKEVTNFYKSHTSPMFLCFVDASKAFDGIDHWTIFRQLLTRGISPILLRIVFWFASNEDQCCLHILICYIHVVSIMVESRIVLCMTLGGILSPTFYNIYIDDLRFLQNIMCIW